MTGHDATDADREMTRLLFRLEDGFERIAETASRGESTVAWMQVWMDLLCEYEQLYQERESRRHGRGAGAGREDGTHGGHAGTTPKRDG
jgi:hypothetical protein